jgi:U3 small nucleolar RNA-associated protein 13
MLRKVYKTVVQQPSFYTGGPIKIGGNNQNLCFCTYGDVINVLELQTGKILHTIKGDEQPITALDVHQETNQIIFSTFSRLVYLLGRNEDYEDQISDPAFQEKSEEEKALITPWKVHKKWKSHERPLIDITFDSTGAFCATASADRTAKVWNIQQGFCTHNFKGHTGVVSLVRCVSYFWILCKLIF